MSIWSNIYGMFDSEKEYDEFLKNHLGHIDFDKPPIDDKYAIPYEMYKYYIENGYVEKRIPLNLETAQKIFDILKNENNV